MGDVTTSSADNKTRQTRKLLSPYPWGLGFSPWKSCLGVWGPYPGRKLSAPFPNLINGIWFRPISGPEFQGGAKNGERVRLTKLAFVLLPCIAYLYCCPALLITFGTFYWQKQKDPFAVGIQRRSLTSGFAVCVHPIIRAGQHLLLVAVNDSPFFSSPAVWMSETGQEAEGKRARKKWGSQRHDRTFHTLSYATRRSLPVWCFIYIQQRYDPCSITFLLSSTAAVSVFVLETPFIRSSAHEPITSRKGQICSWMWSGLKEPGGGKEKRGI